jgi:hypothetical protein
MDTKYLKQAPSSEIVNVSLFKPFFYILENITFQNDYLMSVTLLPFSDILVGYIPLPSLPKAP